METTFLNPELIDVLNIEDFASKKEYGKERGLVASPSEAQARVVDKLWNKINAKVSTKTKKEDEEETVAFDLKSKPRVLLFDAPLLKRSTNSLVQHHTKRHGYLFNDVLLITSSTTSTSMMNFSSEKINIHQILFLDQLCLRDLRNIDSNEDPSAFELISNDRSYILVAETEQDKRIWIEELTMAIFCIQSTVGSKKLGWFHEVIRSTFHSSAFYGEEEILKKHIEKLNGASVDVLDEAGMAPIHWACLSGQLNCVRILLDAGSNVDLLNSGLNSPLLIASSFGYRDIIFLLLDNLADIHLRNLKDYDCLLMLLLFGATGANVEEIITAFKVRGIDINKEDIAGVTPLHECSARNLPLSIQSLVDAGADVNKKHGRSGLTPLQLACSTPTPDVETIRSLLDKGALPNWKDVNKQTAFDFILESSGRKVVKSKNNDTSTPTGLQKTVNEVQDFVQNCLPSLTELARKGARYSPESVEFLRESFREVIRSGVEQWKQAVQPENFQAYANFKGEAAFAPKNWLADSASQNCLLCLDKFTYSNRRHHCRTCGTLCCDLCSTKRLQFKFPGQVSPKGGGKGDGADRVCDSCFNKFVFEAYMWTMNMNRARREQMKLEQSMLEAASNKKNQLMAGSKSPTGPQGSNAMNETMRALEERGQKLDQVNEKSEQLREAAGEFRQMTSKLLQQTQQHVLAPPQNSNTLSKKSSR